MYESTSRIDDTVLDDRIGGVHSLFLVAILIRRLSRLRNVNEG